MKNLGGQVSDLPGPATFLPSTIKRMTRPGISLHVVMELTKFWIAFVASLSAATGYIVFGHRVKLDLVTFFLGVLLVAMGACAMNEFQDRDIDGRMERTSRRPIPAGVVKPVTAFATAALLIAGGLLLLWRVHNLTAALIGLLAVVWYNGVYTYLKRGWAFAVVPGALIGALPPAIGWAAAGGEPLAPQVLALCFFFFIWQVPHFWLLLFMFGSDYSKAGLPSLTELFSLHRLASLTFMWMLSTAASSLLLPIYRLTSSSWTSLGLVVCGVWLVWGARKLLRGRLEPQAPRLAFRRINLYALCVMALLVADALL